MKRFRLPDAQTSRYIIGDALSVLGDNLFFIMLLWAGQQTTGNAAITGILLTVHIIPRILLKLYGGNIADRFAPTRVMLVCLLLQASLLAGAVVWIAYGGSLLAALFALAATFGTINAFLLPATHSTIPRMVPESRLQSMNRIVEVMGYVAQFGGIGLAGLLLMYGMGLTMTVLAGIYLLGGILLSTIRLLPQSKSEVSGHQQGIGSSLRYVWRTPVLRATGVLVFLNNLALHGPINIGLLLVVTDILHFDAATFSTVYLFYSLGGVAFGVLFGGRKVARPGTVLLLCYGLTALVFILVALYANLLLVSIGFFVIGGMWSIGTIVTRSWQQSHTAPERYGSTAAIINLSEIALEPLSRSLAGVLALWSVPGMLLGSGIYLILVTLGVTAKNPVLLQRDKKQNIEPESSIDIE